MLTSQTLLNNVTSTSQSSAQDSLGQLGEDYPKFLTLPWRYGSFGARRNSAI